MVWTSQRLLLHCASFCVLLSVLMKQGIDCKEQVTNLAIVCGECGFKFLDMVVFARHANENDSI